MPNAPSFAVITGAENVEQEGLQTIELSYSEGHRYKTYFLFILLFIYFLFYHKIQVILKTRQSHKSK